MKKLLTILMALVAMVGISFAQQNQPEVIFETDFQSDWNQWKNVDLDQADLNPNIVQQIKQKGEGLNGNKAGWAKFKIFQNNNKLFPVAFSSFAKGVKKSADDWLISPEIQLKEASVVQFYAVNLGKSSDDSIQVYISTTGDNPEDFKKLVYTIVPEADYVIDYYAFLDATELQNQKVRIAFRHVGTDGVGQALTSVKVLNQTDEQRNLQVYFENFDIPNKVKQGTNVDNLTFRISNYGLKKLTSFDLVIESPGLDKPIRHTFTTDLINKEIKEFTIPQPFAFSNVGTHTLKVSTENLNGDNLQNFGDPKYTSFTIEEFEVFDPASTTRLMSLIEHFTSSSCGPCASISPYFKPLYDDNIENLTIIKYPVRWPGNGDPYTSKDAADRVKTYEVSSVPSIFLNGSRYAITARNVNPKYFKSVIMSEHLPGYAKINNPTYKLDKSTKKVSFSMDISNYAPDVYNKKNTKIRIALIEFTTVKNASTNGETEFHYVFHEMIPNTKGIPFTSRGKDDFQNVSVEHDILTKNIENIDNLGFVVFVQDDKDHTILQSSWVTKSSNVEADNSGCGIAGIYPNPTTDFVKVKYNVNGTQNVTAELVNAKGAVIGNYDFGTSETGTYTNTIDVTTLPAGSYILNVKVGKFTFPNTISVVR